MFRVQSLKFEEKVRRNCKGRGERKGGSMFSIPTDWGAQNGKRNKHWGLEYVAPMEL